jgi:putative sigma-54 modulation protein
MHVGEELRDIAENRVGRAERIYEFDVVDVEFSERGNPRRADDRFRVEITTRVAGQTVRVESEAPDERMALDLAADKFERSLRRLKERLIQRSRTTTHKHLNEQLETAEESSETGEYRIVREKQFAMKPMMPEEAVLQMELLDHDFFFFFNGESNRYGVLYRRRDGTLGLIEPV